MCITLNVREQTKVMYRLCVCACVYIRSADINDDYTHINRKCPRVSGQKRLETTTREKSARDANKSAVTRGHVVCFFFTQTFEKKKILNPKLVFLVPLLLSFLFLFLSFLELKEIPRGARAGNCGTVRWEPRKRRRRRRCVSRVDHRVVVSLSRGSFLVLLAFVSLVVVVVGVVVSSSSVLLFLHLDFGRCKNMRFRRPVFFFRLLLPTCLLREQLL